MNKNNIIFFMAGILYIGLAVGYCWGLVGQMPSTPEPYTFRFPIAIAIFLIFPFLFGIGAGLNVRTDG